MCYFGGPRRALTDPLPGVSETRPEQATDFGQAHPDPCVIPGFPPQVATNEKSER